MTNAELNTALYQKMFAEQETYREWLPSSAAKKIAAAIYAVMKNRDKNKIKGRQQEALAMVYRLIKKSSRLCGWYIENSDFQHCFQKLDEI